LGSYFGELSRAESLLEEAFSSRAPGVLAKPTFESSGAGRPPVNGIDSALHAQKIHDQLRKSDPSFDKLVKQFEQRTIPAPQGGGVRIRAKPEVERPRSRFLLSDSHSL